MSRRVSSSAVNMEVKIPMVSVMAKPWIGPVPKAASRIAAITVVRLASRMVENAAL